MADVVTMIQLKAMLKGAYDDVDIYTLLKDVGGMCAACLSDDNDRQTVLNAMAKEIELRQNPPPEDQSS